MGRWVCLSVSLFIPGMHCYFIPICVTDCAEFLCQCPWWHFIVFPLFFTVNLLPLYGDYRKLFYKSQSERRISRRHFIRVLVLHAMREDFNHRKMSAHYHPEKTEKERNCASNKTPLGWIINIVKNVTQWLPTIQQQSQSQRATITSIKLPARKAPPTNHESPWLVGRGWGGGGGLLLAVVVETERVYLLPGPA